MAYSLSFADSFYFPECDPYEVQHSERPTNVLQAIVSMPRDRQIEIAREVMGATDPEFYVDTESFPFDVLDKIRETDTCGTLSSPVDVWIDPDGFYRLDIYDSADDESDGWGEALDRYERGY